MHVKTPRPPSRRSIAATLGPAVDVWDAVLNAIGSEYGALTPEWKASKSEFGWMCALKQKSRTVIYLTPEVGAVRVGLVLGDRAATRALAGELPDEIKALITEARPYAEGRGIRFPVRSVAELEAVMKLVALKLN